MSACLTIFMPQQGWFLLFQPNGFQLFPYISALCVKPNNIYFQNKWKVSEKESTILMRMKKKKKVNFFVQ